MTSDEMSIKICISEEISYLSILYASVMFATKGLFCCCCSVFFFFLFCFVFVCFFLFFFCVSKNYMNGFWL